MRASIGRRYCRGRVVVAIVDSILMLFMRKRKPEIPPDDYMKHVVIPFVSALPPPSTPAAVQSEVAQAAPITHTPTASRHRPQDSRRSSIRSRCRRACAAIASAWLGRRFNDRSYLEQQHMRRRGRHTCSSRTCPRVAWLHPLRLSRQQGAFRQGSYDAVRSVYASALGRITELFRRPIAISYVA